MHQACIAWEAMDSKGSVAHLLVTPTLHRYIRLAGQDANMLKITICAFST